MRVAVGMASALVAALALGDAALAQAPFKAGGIVLGAPAVPPSPALQIAEFELTTQVAFGRPVDRVRAFKAEQGTIFAWVRYTGGQPGASLVARLVFLAPAGEIEAALVSGKVEKPDDIGAFRFTAPADGWPEGRYRLDLVANGVTLRAQEFLVGRAR